MAFPDERWVRLLGADPRQWLVQSEDPAARWITLAQLLDFPSDDPAVVDAHRAVLDSPATAGLLDQVGDWETHVKTSGHASPKFVPNVLNLLADMGLGPGDDRRIERMLDSMLLHQTSEGRFQALGGGDRISVEPVWTSLLCDSHAVIEVLIRFGRSHTSAVRAGLDRMAADVEATAQGLAWPCIPDAATGFRGPGRKADFCPQVTLEALRVIARLPAEQRPAADCSEAARAALRAWRRRGDGKPYMFGHGLQFKTIKWPPFWYGIYWFLDTLGRYPDLWAGESSGNDDRRALAELVKCLVAYNVQPNGRVVPMSCYQGFEGLSLGQKKRESALATAMLAVVLRRFETLVEDAATVDVSMLTSSKGGSGVARPPKL